MAPTLEQLQGYLASVVPTLGGQAIYQVICETTPSGKITDLDDRGRLTVAMAIADRVKGVAA